MNHKGHEGSERKCFENASRLITLVILRVLVWFLFFQIDLFPQKFRDKLFFSKHVEWRTVIIDVVETD